MLRRSCPSELAFPLVLLWALGGFASDALAQDFKVVTRVSQQRADGGGWDEVAQSVTLFHAGKVYDYMQQIGEVVVFEPAESQFVIFSVNGNNLATSLHFSELQRYLKLARADTEEHLKRLETEGAASAKRRQALLFQLDPEFDESFDPTTGTLTFNSPMLRYEVQSEATKRPLVVQQYLQYADWAARMNYVLHSGTLYPDVRLAVNRSLAERERIPTSVRLLLDGSVPIRLKAEHKFEWTLGTIDRSMIRNCEKDRTADTTRWVNFLEYQRSVSALAAQR